MSLSPAHQGHLAMLCFSALVAGSFSLGGRVGAFIDPAALNALRFVLAAAVLAALAAATGGLRRTDFAAPWRFFVLASLYGFYFVTMFEGLRIANPVNMAAVFTLNPGLAAVFGYMLLRQVTSGWMALAITTGAIGALWVIFEADWSAFSAFDVGRGEAIYFWGCVAHAAYAPSVRKLSRGEPALAFNAGILCAGAVLVSLWAAPELARLSWSTLPPLVWITVLYTALPATALTVVILRFASLRLPAANVLAYTYLTPCWVILWEIALGSAPPPAWIIPGVGLTLLALVMLLRD